MKITRKYIDRAALFNDLSNAKTLADAFAAIQAAPGADVAEVRRGEWVLLYEANPYDTEAECSICHNITKMPTCLGKPIYKWCPHCGAVMKVK